MADLQPTDKLLVNRAGVDYSIAQSDVMATVQDTDLFLVNRGNVDYQATYADVKKGFGPQSISPAPGDWTFAPAVVSGSGTQADPYVLTASTVTAPDVTATAAQVMTLTGLNPNDLVQWTDNSVGAGTRFNQPMSIVPAGGQVDLQLVFNDNPVTGTGTTYTGDLQIGTTYFRWDVTKVVGAVNKPSIIAPADGAGTATDPTAAPDASGLTLQSSAFVSTPAGSLTQTQSDWQVTTLADTGYTAIVAQSMADGTNLTTWTVAPELDPDTEYRCRVKHRSGTLDSAWSDDVTFKTNTESTPSAVPGDVYRVGDDGILAPLTGPVKFINASVNSVRTLAVGTDGDVYQALTADNTFTKMNIPNIVSVATDGDAQDGGVLTMARCATLSDTFVATAYTTTAAGTTPVDCPVPIRVIGCPGTYSNVIYALPEDGRNEIYFFTHRAAVTFLGKTSLNAWDSIAVPGLPANEKILRIAAYGEINAYSADAILILCESGNLYAYAAPGVTSSSLGLATPATATLLLPDVKDIACAGGCFSGSDSQGVSALLNDGTVYWSNNYRNISWGLFPGVGTCKSPIFGGYTNAPTIALVLKDDGLVYGADRTTSVFTQLDYATNSAPTTPLNRLGSLIYGSVSDVKSVLILPT